MADFRIAVAQTLVNEGGFQNEPNDAGNWTGGAIGKGECKGTKYGISAREFPTLDIPNLTTEQAEQIYETKYWFPLYNQIVSQLIANKLFDQGVNEGVETAVRILQDTIGATPDGGFGIQTLTLLNAANPYTVLAEYKVKLVAHVIQMGAQDPALRSNIPGLIRRINS